MQTEPKYADKAEAKRAKRERAKARKRQAREDVYKAWSKHLPQPVDHALERWAERFPPDLGFWATYHVSRPVEWRDIARKVLSAGLKLRLSFDSQFRIHDKTGAVFVIDTGWGGLKVVKTVVRLNI